jgi:hypothetical protein
MRQSRSPSTTAPRVEERTTNAAGTIMLTPPAWMRNPERRCRLCRTCVPWLSVHGVIVCGTCHPPAGEEVLRRWLSPAHRDWLWQGELAWTGDRASAAVRLVPSAG